jgi:hypothetical protein
MDTEQDLLLQREQPATPKSLSLAATAAPAPGANKSGYYSENGYLKELSGQKRRRIEQEIKERFKPGETWNINAPIIVHVHVYCIPVLYTM